VRIETAGAGILLRSGALTEDGVAQAANKLATGLSYRFAAQQVAGTIGSLSPCDAGIEPASERGKRTSWKTLRVSQQGRHREFCESLPDDPPDRRLAVLSWSRGSLR
jgi:hypothetical protein